MTTTAAPHLDDVPDEASLDRAPDLIEGARTLQMTAAGCGLEHWLRAVAQGTLRGLVNGHRPEAAVPAWMREDGPLRQALRRGVRLPLDRRGEGHPGAVVPRAARSGHRRHGVLRHPAARRGPALGGVPRPPARARGPAGRAAPRRSSGSPARTATASSCRWRTSACRWAPDDGDFIGGVVVLTVLVEGVLAPAAELSERKWRLARPGRRRDRAGRRASTRSATSPSAARSSREHLLRAPRGAGPPQRARSTRGRAMWGVAAGARHGPAPRGAVPGGPAGSTPTSSATTRSGPGDDSSTPPPRSAC